MGLDSKMYKSSKKFFRTCAIGAALANGYWASVTQSRGGHEGLTPMLMAMASVLVCYFSLAWLFQGMRSK
jgi:hypothetical protein